MRRAVYASAATPRSRVWLCLSLTGVVVGFDKDAEFRVFNRKRPRAVVFDEPAGPWAAAQTERNLRSKRRMMLGEDESRTPSSRRQRRETRPEGRRKLGQRHPKHAVNHPHPAIGGDFANVMEDRRDQQIIRRRWVRCFHLPVHPKEMCLVNGRQIEECPALIRRENGGKNVIPVSRHTCEERFECPGPGGSGFEKGTTGPRPATSLAPCA